MKDRGGQSCPPFSFTQILRRKMRFFLERCKYRRIFAVLKYWCGTDAAAMQRFFCARILLETIFAMSWCGEAVMPPRLRTSSLSSTTHGFIFAKILVWKSKQTLVFPPPSKSGGVESARASRHCVAKASQGVK